MKSKESGFLEMDTRGKDALKTVDMATKDSEY